MDSMGAMARWVPTVGPIRQYPGSTHRRHGQRSDATAVAGAGLARHGALPVKPPMRGKPRIYGCGFYRPYLDRKLAR